MKQRLQLIFKKLLAYLPSKLPVGMTELHKFMDDIIEISGQYADPISMKFVLANAIMRLDSAQNTVSKQYLARIVHRAASGQLAGAIFTEIKHAQQQAELELRNKQQAEATASQQGDTSGKPPVS